MAHRIANRSENSCIEHPHGSPGNPQFISRRYALTSAQNVKSMSVCLRIRREFCKIEWCAAAGRIEPECRMSRSGRGSTKKKWRSADCSTKQESWAGAKRSDIISLTNSCSANRAVADEKSRLRSLTGRQFSVSAIAGLRQLTRACFHNF